MERDVEHTEKKTLKSGLYNHMGILTNPYTAQNRFVCLTVVACVFTTLEELHSIDLLVYHYGVLSASINIFYKIFN